MRGVYAEAAGFLPPADWLVASGSAPSSLYGEDVVSESILAFVSLSLRLASSLSRSFRSSSFHISATSILPLWHPRTGPQWYALIMVKDSIQGHSSSVIMVALVHCSLVNCTQETGSCSYIYRQGHGNYWLYFMPGESASPFCSETAVFGPGQHHRSLPCRRTTFERKRSKERIYRRTVFSRVAAVSMQVKINITKTVEYSSKVENRRNGGPKKKH